MAAIVVTSTAQADLDRIIVSHSLPASVRERVRHAISPLGEFPLLGATLRGRWAAFRFILGPWRWMIIVYHFDPQANLVAVVAIEDARSASFVTSSEKGRQP